MKPVTLLTVSDDPHVERLIPWYLNGTLDADGRRRVEVHLESCARCRTSHQLEARLAAQLREPREAPGCAPLAGWSRLEARLDLPRKPLSPAMAVRNRPLRKTTAAARSHLLAAVLLAQAAVIAGLGFALSNLTGGRDTAAYRTLGDSASARMVAEAPLLRIVFSEETDNARLRVLLRHVDGAIRSGPSAAGVYTVELSSSGAAEALDWLRRQPEVLFAERVEAPALE